ncbi:1-acyl-sn-glycerol-3-phosphate acyltransferase [Spirochaetia bacterium]|nr:1-acyl-sn-glycerol-3-phosphate acyltransferase [Spirochaetia bacterium]
MAHPDLPPVSNWAVYSFRVIVKWFSFFIFGAGTLFLVFAVFPVMRLCIHPALKFRKYARSFVSLTMRFFVNIMTGIGAVKLDADYPGAWRKLSSKIIVANHPSLLDVVMLLSLIPNADCIVRGNLSRNIVGGVIKQLYITNSLSFEELSRACIQSLDEGNCIIIFPEGTRTPRSGPGKMKKGAARLSLLSGSGIVPVYIGGNDKYGLGKRDPWWAYNHEEKYLYRIRMQDEISPEKYIGLPVPIGAKHLNTEITEILHHPRYT